VASFRASLVYFITTTNTQFYWCSKAANVAANQTSTVDQSSATPPSPPPPSYSAAAADTAAAAAAAASFCIFTDSVEMQPGGRRFSTEKLVPANGHGGKKADQHIYDDIGPTSL